MESGKFNGGYSDFISLSLSVRLLKLVFVSIRRKNSLHANHQLPSADQKKSMIQQYIML